MSNNKIQSSAVKILSGKQGEYPIKIQLIAQRLSVTILLHTINKSGKPLQCWSYISDGMKALKQQEIILTLAVADTEHIQRFPTAPFQLLMLLFKQALLKKGVRSGDVISFGEKGLLGYSGACFVFPYAKINNMPAPSNALFCLMLHKQEFLVAKAFGSSRVVSILSFDHKRFPYPAWNERDRNAIDFSKVIQQSVLKDTNKFPVNSASVYMYEGDQIILNVLRRSHSTVLEQFKKNAGKGKLAMILPLKSFHDGSLAWYPNKGSTEIPMASNTEGNYIAGSFFMFELSNQECGASMLEDGFIMRFDEQSWPQFRDAIVRAEDISVSGVRGAMNFSLQWTDDGLPTNLSAETNGQGQRGVTSGSASDGLISRLLQKIRG